MLGYFPIIGGQFIGIIRWIDGIKRINDDGISGYVIANLIRGTVEFLGLGLLMGLIDILVTLGRLLSATKSAYNESYE